MIDFANPRRVMSRSRRTTPASARSGDQAEEIRAATDVRSRGRLVASTPHNGPHNAPHEESARDRGSPGASNFFTPNDFRGAGDGLEPTTSSLECLATPTGTSRTSLSFKDGWPADFVTRERVGAKASANVLSGPQPRRRPASIPTHVEIRVREKERSPI